MRNVQLSFNVHGVGATPENVSRCHHDRFPHPDPLPEGEGDWERAVRDFHGNLLGKTRRSDPILVNVSFSHGTTIWPGLAGSGPGHKQMVSALGASRRRYADLTEM